MWRYKLNSNRLLIIDGNSIMNRAFYGIMSSKTLMSADGTYTNAIYGFLAILFAASIGVLYEALKVSITDWNSNNWVNNTV